MSVIKYTTLMLAIACCNYAVAQQQVDQSRRDRVEDRRDQLSENLEERRDQLGELREDNREDRQDNRDARQAQRDPADRPLAETVGAVVGSAIDQSMNQSKGQSMDQFIATCLLIGNQEEVALAKEAVNRAENENLKQFAQTLINDHQKAIQKLQQHAKQGMGLDQSNDVSLSSTGQAQLDQYAANPSPTAQQYTTNRQDLDRDPMKAGALDQVLKMHQKAAQECLSMTKSMMQEKQGAEFDKAFAGSQIGAHVGMLAKLKASQEQASPELSSIIQESEQTVQRHLEQAKQLCQELEAQHASNR